MKLMDDKGKRKKFTDKTVSNAPPREKIYKLFDYPKGHGLHVVITPTGGRYWRLKYYFGGQERLLSLGVYPHVTLATARELREAARARIKDGIDPAAERAAGKADLGDTSFESVARLWLAVRAGRWKPGHLTTVASRLERHIFPKLGALPIKAVDAAKIAEVVNTVEDNGHFETARRICQYTGAVIRFAIRKRIGGVESDPTLIMRDGLAEEAKQRVVKNRPAITEPTEVGALMRNIEGYAGSPVVRAALKLHALTALRSRELRCATWDEIDFETAIWRVPAARMKVQRAGDHIVPLARQSLEVLEELHRETGDGPLLFPGGRGATRPLSENAVGAALRTMGYFKKVKKEVRDKNGKLVKGKFKDGPASTMTPHGFRTIFSTLMNELDDEYSNAVEKQLAHINPNSIKVTYDKSTKLPARWELMQRWADYLDCLANPEKGAPPKAPRKLAIVKRAV